MMVVKYPSTSVPLWLLWQLFGYVMEAHLHTHEGEERHSDRQKSPTNALSWLLPSAHQRPIFPKPKGAQGHSVRPGNQIRGLEEGDPSGGRCLGCPQRALVQVWNPWRRVKPGALFQLRGGCSLGVWDTLWMQGKSSLRLHKAYYRMSRGGTKSGQRDGARWLGKEQV